jgi:thymidine kinase
MLPYSFIYNGRDYDIIAIKANMAVGKTEKLYDIIDNYEKVVIVSFRISLDKQYAERLSNFELYLNINKDVYDTSIHNKIIVQMDSFNKVRGEIDLLIIDEITYRMFQLIYSQKKEENFNSIKQYLNNPSTKYS